MHAHVQLGIAESQWGKTSMDVNSLDFLADLRSKGPNAQRAFRQLVRLTHAKLARFLGRYLRTHDQIQDAMQETYLGVFRGLPRFAGQCRLSTWIFSLAYRKACDCLAQKYRHNFLHSGYEGEREVGDITIEQALPLDEAFDQSRLVQQILAAAQELPKIYLDAYQLRDLDGLSGEEAAEILGISVSLIRVRLHRARGLIVGMLQKKCPKPPIIQSYMAPITADAVIHGHCS